MDIMQFVLDHKILSGSAGGILTTVVGLIGYSYFGRLDKKREMEKDAGGNETVDKGSERAPLSSFDISSNGTVNLDDVNFIGGMPPGIAKVTDGATFNMKSSLVVVAPPHLELPPPSGVYSEESVQSLKKK